MSSGSTGYSLIFSNSLLTEDHIAVIPCRVGQSVTCQTADMCLTANPMVASSIPDWSNTFVEIDHEINYTAILLPTADSRRVIVSYQ